MKAAEAEGTVLTGAARQRRVPAAVCVLSGAAATVAVAWGCTLWSPYTRSSQPSLRCGHEGWPELTIGPDGTLAYWEWESGRGVGYAYPMSALGMEGMCSWGSSWGNSGTPAYFWAGWPMPTLRSTVRVARGPSGEPLSRWDLPVGEILQRGVCTDDLPAWVRARGDRRLPIIPAFPGFAVMTAVNASVVWGMLAGFGRARRRLRVRRGVCVVCCYSLVGNTTGVCPECGCGGQGGVRPGYASSPERPT